jgi:hypothetical protein
MSIGLLRGTLQKLLSTHTEEILRPLTFQEQRALNMLILAVDLCAEATVDQSWRTVALIAMRSTVDAMGSDARAVAEKLIPLVLAERHEPGLWDLIRKSRESLTATATLRSDSPRAESWRAAYGELSVPILSPLPVLAETGGAGEGESLVYFLDAAALSPERLEHLIAHLARSLGETPDVVFEHLRRERMPIIVDEYVEVTIPAVDLVLAIGRQGRRADEARNEQAREALPPLAIGTRGARRTRGIG